MRRNPRGVRGRRTSEDGVLLDYALALGILVTVFVAGMILLDASKNPRIEEGNRVMSEPVPCSKALREFANSCL